MKHFTRPLALAFLAGCGGAPKAAPQSVAGTPASSPQAESTAGVSTAATPPAVAPGKTAPADEARAPAAEPAPVAPATAAEAPKASGRSGPAPSRAAVEAGGAVERAQRDLEVAGGDCMNACRALGSMDRATGRLCGLAQSNDDHDRCSDASTKLKKARDRVKRTCGSCPDVTVERDATIPSR